MLKKSYSSVQSCREWSIFHKVSGKYSLTVNKLLSRTRNLIFMADSVHSRSLILWYIIPLSPQQTAGVNAFILTTDCQAVPPFPLFLRNIHEHMQCGRSLVSFWHSEVWVEIWLLDIWRLALRSPDDWCWHLRLHAQWRVGSNRWVGRNICIVLSSKTSWQISTKSVSLWSYRCSWHQKWGLLWLL